MREVDRWLNDAPDPEPVPSQVLALVARQVKTMSDRQLGLEDHVGRMRLVLAADFYYDFFHEMVCGYVPEAAVEVAELHRRFAKMVLRVSPADAADGNCDGAVEVSALEALAEECFLARGRICKNCGLPMCLHSDIGPDGAAGRGAFGGH